MPDAKRKIIRFSVRNTYAYGHSFAVVVDTLEEFPAEKLHAHDREYQPKHETHQQHVKNWRDRIH